MARPTRRRNYGSGGLRERSDNSWELKVRTIDPRSGRRVVKFYTFKGSKQAATHRLRELMSIAEAGALPDEKKLFGDVIDVWDATLNVSPKTAERYRELATLYIRPHLGGIKARSLVASRIEQFYVDLLSGKRPDGSEGSRLAPRTIGHIHRLVVQMLALAERDRVIDSNPAPHARRPKIEETELEILNEDEVRDVLTKLRGRNSPNGRVFYTIVLLALASGMRRGEVLAMRWKDVDFERAETKVQQSLEQTRGDEPLRFKPPKTKRGRRTITLPQSVITELRSHRASQAAQRLALGLGKDSEDGLVFRHPDGSPLLPNNVTTEWRRLVEVLKLPEVTFHAFRHTHASQLIASGMDVLTISRRLGHSSASITLNIYGHLFKPTDKTAAAVIERALGMMAPE